VAVEREHLFEVSILRFKDGVQSMNTKNIDGRSRSRVKGKSHYVIPRSFALAIVLCVLKILFKVLYSHFFRGEPPDSTNPTLLRYVGWDLFFDFIVYTAISLIALCRHWEAQEQKHLSSG
jgi:hypothetical protein